MMRTFSFEKLQVWEKSRELTSLIYSKTTVFPEEEQFGLISQMRRCCISIGSNIAEGSSRHSKKDKARFTEIAYGSALELLNQTILSNDLGFIKSADYLKIREIITSILAMLDGLYKSQIKA